MRWTAAAPRPYSSKASWSQRTESISAATAWARLTTFPTLSISRSSAAPTPSGRARTRRVQRRHRDRERYDSVPGARILRHVVPTELPVKDGAVDISGDASLCFVCCANRYGLGKEDHRRVQEFWPAHRRACLDHFSRQPQPHRVLPRRGRRVAGRGNCSETAEAACARQTTAPKRTLSFLRQG